MQARKRCTSLSSLLPPPHQLPMAGCCVLRGQGRRLLTLSSPLDRPVAVIALTSVVCWLLFSLPKASPPPMLLSPLLPIAFLPPQPQQPKTILSRQTRGTDCCIVVIIASWIDIYGIIASPPLQTYRPEQRRAARQWRGCWIRSRRGRRRKAWHNCTPPSSLPEPLPPCPPPSNSHLTLPLHHLCCRFPTPCRSCHQRCTHNPLRQRSNGLNTLYMSTMDVWSGLRWISASPMTLWHHFHSTESNIALYGVENRLWDTKIINASIIAIVLCHVHVENTCYSEKRRKNTSKY